MPEQYLSSPPHPDSPLVKAVIGGETGAFEQLIHAHEKLVNSIVYKMVGQVQDREDICQEAFLRVYKNLGAFRFQSKLSTWIANIAFNLCVNHLKKKKNLFLDDFARGDENSGAFDQLPAMNDRQPLPDQTLLNKERVQLLVKVVATLNPVERTLLQLFHQDDFSLEEISSITSIPVNTVKSHLFRARKNLKDQMTKHLNA
jgi:RNA polymerase sigma factor (sigma-70 family)